MTTCNHCGGAETQPVFTMDGCRLVKCTGCGLVYLANPPSGEDLQKMYSADADYHTQLYDPAGHDFALMTENAAIHMKFVQKIAQNGRLLDVGCSVGHFLDRARSAGFDCSGVEFSKESRDFAQQHFALPVEGGSIHDVSHGDASLDLITMFDVIEHVPDPAADIAKAYRLLKPGGWFVLSTPNIDGLFPRVSYKLAHTLNYWPHPEPPHHIYQFSIRTLRAMLEKGGFTAGPVAHRNIALSYTFGTPHTLIRMPKRLAYAALFAPFAAIGPLVKSGDWFYIAARKPA